MAKLKLRLEGVMQSWGKREPWAEGRGTESRPTDSAVYGIIACAMGIHRDEEDRLARLRDDIKVTGTGTVRGHGKTEDTQTVRPLKGDMKFPSADGEFREMQGMLFSKEYLQGSECFAEISGTDDAICEVRYYLDHPVYPYYLGRYCCTPSERVVFEEPEICTGSTEG